MIHVTGLETHRACGAPSTKEKHVPRVQSASRRYNIRLTRIALALWLVCGQWQTAMAAECRQISVAARICAEGGLSFAEPQSETAPMPPNLIDMRLPTEAHGDVTITFIGHRAAQTLGTLAGFRTAYLDQMENRGATLAERYMFRHRGAAAVAQQFIAIHPGPGAGQFWGVAFGVELTDGLIMGLITADRAANADLRAGWTAIALDALYPGRVP
jgi:hypothetical protein